MANLSDARGSLRFCLSLGAFESAPLPRRAVAEAGEALRPRHSLPIAPSVPPQRRLLASASMDFFDAGDKEFWPFVRLGVLWLGPGDARELALGLARLIRDEVPGFTFRSVERAGPEASATAAGFSELALQVGRLGETTATATVYAVEIGLDLARVLSEASGALNAPGEALALFRFTTGRPALVAFGQELAAELASVEHSGGVAAEGAPR